MSDHDQQIVTGLKDPWKFIFIDMDIAILAGAVGMLAVGAGASSTVTVLIASAFAYLIHSFRRGRPKGFAKHFAYWYLPPSVVRLRTLPPMWSPRSVG